MLPLLLLAVAADPADHFETKVRPLLVEHCQRCHAAPTAGKEPKGSLRVDGRDHLLTGGDGGPAVVPGDPDKSKLIEAVRYANPDLLMPPKGKLPDAAIRDLEAWVKAGAPWPNATATAETKAGFDLAGRKAAHWAWQPLASPAAPAGSGDPVDRFIKQALAERGLSPAPPADAWTLHRRLSFALVGLPPEEEPGDYAKHVDALLASPHFGERWGRHWLDLVRYAESRGHEFEPEIPNAFQYRDYVIRALNADVPYDRFVREHLAGDVLPAPRLDPATGANESVFGPGFWHLGEEVHSPVDVRQDQTDRFDNRIDVATKTFLGLTVSCARCHDHKFDAIGTKDYYALFALLEGSSYRQARCDGWQQNRAVAGELAALRERFAASHPTTQAAPVDDAERAFLAQSQPVIDFGNLKPGEWLPDDVTFGPGPRQGGRAWPRVFDGKLVAVSEPRTAAAFDRFWSGLTLAPDAAKEYGKLGERTRPGFTLRTPTFVLTAPRVHLLVRGGGACYAAVGQHAVIAGPLHGKLVRAFADAADYRWVTHDLSEYVGQRLHLELTADPQTDFAVAMVVQSDATPPGVPHHAAEPQPASSDFAAREAALAKRVVWQSRLALTQWDGPAADGRVFVRGNPRTLGAAVPPRSLEALAGTAPLSPVAGTSGRVELAEQWTDPARTPLVARVAVNRVWHHLFGRGLVATPDNLGALGEPPTHAALLDHLATQFVTPVADGGLGWSVKRLVRRLVLTDTYRMASATDAPPADPDNRLLSAFRVKRLEGEALRDAMLAVSGRLDRTVGGPSVPLHLTPFLDGRGRPMASGPVDGAGRRSVYLAVRRNFLTPFFQAFDAPVPFSTVGRRQTSNVPAQALILLNDPFVHEQADRWGAAVAKESGSAAERAATMVRRAFGRPATAAEVAACVELLDGRDGDAAAWAAVAHGLFNTKAFAFVR